MASSFARSKMMWLNKLSCDHRVKAVEFRVAYRIADHYNPHRMMAWPSQVRLAAQSGVSVRTVQRAIDKLVKRDYLIVERCRGESNKYRLQWVDAGVFKSDFADRPRRHPSRNPYASRGSLNYIENLPRTFLDLAADKAKKDQGRSSRLSDRGKYEMMLAKQLGRDGYELIHYLSIFTLDRLCNQLRDLGHIDEAAIVIAIKEAETLRQIKRSS